MENSSSDTSSAIPPFLGALRSNVHLMDATTVLLLSDAECDAIVADLDEQGWNEMRVWSAPPDDAGFGAHRAVIAADVRRGLQRPVPGGNSGPLATRIAEQIFDVNRRVYGFRLVGVEDPVQVLCYRSDSDDGYTEHLDIGPVTSLRKLSFSLLLSDPATFEGGDLDFGNPFPLARAQGTLTVFPSFLRHGVTRVTSGVRYAIVGFAVGPAFS